VAFGTDLDPDKQIQASRDFARSAANPSASGWRAKGDQKRSYYFPEANKQVSYRLSPSSHLQTGSRRFAQNRGRPGFAYRDPSRCRTPQV
jgi:hypothetical protein